MANEFTAQVFQNEYLPSGSGEVHAIMTVTAKEATRPATQGRLFGIICDCSGSMEGQKIIAARGAMMRLVQMLPPDCGFFIIAGSDTARIVYPLSLATDEHKKRAMAAIKDIRAVGGTLMSLWLRETLRQFQGAAGALKQALLLTDGQNEKDNAPYLETALKECEGVFQCDCRGVGTDWEVGQLRAIAGKLMGTTDIIPTPDHMEADFRAILAKAMSKSVSDVFVRLWTPQGARIKFLKQVSPEILDLTGKARQPKPQVQEFPTGAWGQDESRDFHFCIAVPPGNVGDEVLAGRASLVCNINGTENKFAEGRILAIWTDDEAKSTKINKVVAHYTGQADLAQSIQEGLEARNQGNDERATVLLGKAVRIAHESGNEGTAKLLRNIVEVDDAATGTVRLKRSVSKEAEMMLDTRSTKTARIARTS
jgi:TusA-related sulfurtransferase